jgi:hypothetical protein
VGKFDDLIVAGGKLINVAVFNFLNCHYVVSDLP